MDNKAISPALLGFIVMRTQITKFLLQLQTLESQAESSYLQAMFVSYIWNTKRTSCLDLGLISKVSHYIHANVPKAKKSPQSGTFLISGIWDRAPQAAQHLRHSRWRAYIYWEHDVPATNSGKGNTDQPLPLAATMYTSQPMLVTTGSSVLNTLKWFLFSFLSM